MRRLAPALLAALLACPQQGVALPAAAQDPTAAATPAPPPPSSAVAAVEEVALAVSVTPERATVGDVVSYRIDVETPPTHAVGEPVFIAAPGSFELRDEFRPAGERTVGGRVQRSFVALLAPFATGEQTLPAAEVVVQGPGIERRVVTPAVGLAVASVLPAGETPELRGAKGLVDFGRDLPRWLLAALALGLLALLAAVWRWRRRVKLLPAAPARPVLPYDEQALADLDELLASPLLPTGKVKEFHVRLSEILRAYLGARYGFDALEMTSEELLRDLRGRGVAPAARERVRAVTDEIDLVKFARFLPAPAAGEALAREARALVQATRPPRVASGLPAGPVLAGGKA